MNSYYKYAGRRGKILQGGLIDIAIHVAIRLAIVIALIVAIAKLSPLFALALLAYILLG